MTDYKSIYFYLFNRVVEAVAILQKAQQESVDAWLDIRDSESE